MMIELVRNINALWIIIYCSIITTAFGLQIFLGEEPCPLCYLQRVAMIAVSITACLNLVYGIRLRHYGLAIIASLFGAAVATRQILLHICPGFPEFGIPFWGLSLYVWSYITFICSILLTSILLFLYRPEQEEAIQLNAFQKFACGWLMLVACGNILSAFLECGLGWCKG